MIERCQIWIYKQNYNIISALFKKFVKQELLPSINIIKNYYLDDSDKMA